MSHVNIPIFVPEVGCPHRCVFCNQYKITEKSDYVSVNQAKLIIDSYLETIKSGTMVEIAFFGGSFTGIDIDLQEKLLSLAYHYVKLGIVGGIRISTRPDYIDTQRLDLLRLYGVTAIELGAQSLDNDVLFASGRGHAIDDVKSAAKLIRQYGFELGLQMMIGLPDSNTEKDIMTAKGIIELGASTTRIYPCLVIRDTKLECMYNSGSYLPLSLSEAVAICADLVPIFEDSGVKILRVGLHASEGLTNGENLVAGPFHISFRELVESEIWNRMFQKYGFCTSYKNIVIKVHTSSVNHAVGYYGCNKKMLEKYFQSVKFVTDSKLKKREFYVDYN